MSKIIVIPGHTSAAVLIALLLRQQAATKPEDPIIDITGDWKDCWECGTEHQTTDQCHVCHPVVPL